MRTVVSRPREDLINKLPLKRANIFLAFTRPKPIPELSFRS